MAHTTQHPEPEETKVKRFAPLIARIKALFVVRVFQYYTRAPGVILANGLANQAIFALFAALWVGFSVAGVIIAGNPKIQDALITIIANAIPGLIKTSDTPGGAISPDVLLNAGVFTWTGIIALIAVLVTALGWMASARTAIRHLFALPQSSTNFVLLKLSDLLLAICFGAVLIFSAALSVAGSSATGFLLGIIGVNPHSTLATVVSRVATLTIMYALDSVVLAGLFRFLSGAPIPLRRLASGVLMGALGLGVLKVLAGTLLGVSKNNPLLASFAVILGLLIFLNFACQVILISASWVTVSMADRGIPIDPTVEKRRLAQEKEEHDAIAAEAVAAAEAARPHGLGRFFGGSRRKNVGAGR